MHHVRSVVGQATTCIHSTIIVEAIASKSTIIGDMARTTQPKSLFGRRLREARLRADIPQDKLGVKIGLDEGSASARMSRYECGIHEPPYEVAEQIAKALKVPAAYFYCSDDRLAELMLIYFSASARKRDDLLTHARTL